MRLWVVALAARARVDRLLGRRDRAERPELFRRGRADIVVEASELVDADNENHCWRIEPAAGGATALTVLFDLFQTEHCTTATAAATAL